MQYCGITFEGRCYVKDNYEKHRLDPAGNLLYASPSMVAAFQWPMSLQSMVRAEKTAQREVSHLCDMSGSPLPAPSHRDTLVPGALTAANPSARWSPASLGVLHVSCCLAALLVIPAMGKRSPAERQLLAPEILPKNPRVDFLPTQPPLLHHSAQSLPMTQRILGKCSQGYPTGPSSTGIPTGKGTIRINLKLPSKPIVIGQSKLL